jgi:glycosyltransferase involved in cell wall biosynthesis
LIRFFGAKMTLYQNDINEPFVSVIIPVFNDPNRLMLCLTALNSQTYCSSKYEIIIIDNDSTVKITEVTKQFENVKLLFEEQKGSYSARNRGIRESSGEILAFTDADCLPDDDWIEKGVKRLLENADCGIVGGKIDFFFADEDSPTTAEIYESLTYLNQSQFIENLHFSATANLFTRRRIFDKVGFFLADLRSGGDFEWGQRVFAKGLELIYAEEVRVKHPARRTVREVLARQRRIRGGAWLLKEKGVSWVNPHELNLFWGLTPPLRRSIKLWQNQDLQGLWQKMKVIGLENLSHYANWVETLRLRLGGDPKN